MEDEKMVFLPEDVYNFLGQEIVVRSNSNEVLAHLRTVYGHFYQGCDEAASSKKKKRENTSRLMVEIEDNFTTSNELIVNDSFYLYRLSRQNGHYHWKCQDINTLTDDGSGICHPLYLVQTAILRTVTLLIKDYYLIHAGAVSWKNKGMIFPANQDMGKTTLVVKLVMNGCKFLSDEIACLNPDLNVLESFPRGVSIRNNSRELLGLSLRSDTVNDYAKIDEGKWMINIDDIVPDSISNSCTPHYIIFLRGFGEKPRLEYISSSNAVFELLKFSYATVDTPGALLFGFASLVNKIQCFNLVMGNIDETAELVMQLADKGR